MQLVIDHIEKLRAKPEHHRRRWAFGWSVALTGIIVIVWVINLSLTLSAGGLTAPQPEPVSPFGQVAGAMVDNIAAIKNGFLTVVGDLVSLFQ